VTAVHGAPVEVTPALLRDWPLPAPGADKDASGQLLVVGGTGTTPGAVLLAGEAALRSGMGKLQVATVGSTAVALAVAVPEAKVIGLPQTAQGSLGVDAGNEIVSLAGSAAAVLVGPGFDDPTASVALLSRVVPRVSTAMVVDALASAYLTEQPAGLRHLDGRVVLTVNPTELARTAGWAKEAVEHDPVTPAAQVAERSGVVVLCGGREKLVLTPGGNAWVVRGGGPGLASSGSGDVQAGIVGGLLARGAEPAQAAVWAAYIHARAGERRAAQVGILGYLARELPGEVPEVLSELQ
jgi:ADP-dependent NAD(P)H-hydrate dehydratase